MNIKNLENFLIAWGRKDSRNAYNLYKRAIDEGIEVFDEQTVHFIKARNNEAPIDPKFIINERKRFEDAINTTKGHLSISAPTSFGKTFLVLKRIEQVHRALVITPTLSLANEYFFKMKKHKDKNISMSPNVRSNKYILTPEKASILLETEKDFDVIVFDEFYESYSPMRTPIFKDAFYKAKRATEQLITIIPSSTKMFLDGKEIVGEKIHTNLSVTTRKYVYYVMKNNRTHCYVSSELPNAEKIPFRILNEKYNVVKGIDQYSKNLKGDQNILVLTTKGKMYKLASEINFSHNAKGPIINELVKYLSEYSPGTNLENLIKKGIAYHNGSMDKYVRLLIEKAFEKGEIKVLFANTTLTKGVNIDPTLLIIDAWTNANQNVITKIEDKNTLGRTGRATSRGSLVGTVAVFTTNLNDVKTKRADSNKENSQITLKEEVIKSPLVSDSFEKAYQTLLANYKFSELGKGTQLKNMINEQMVNSVKNYIGKRDDENARELTESIAKMFLDEYSEKSMRAIKIQGSASLRNVGYSNYYYNQMKKDLFVNYSGWTSEVNKDGYFSVQKNSFGRDLLLLGIVKNYQNEYGYYFQQLVNIVIRQIGNIGLIDNKIIEEFRSLASEEESISTRNGWPDAVTQYFLSKKTDKLENHLNDIVKKLLE